MNQIPREEDWGDYWKDIDMKGAHASYFGKSNQQMQHEFYKNGNYLISELRFMPPKPFLYYMLGFRDFILADNFPPHEASDFSSYFLWLVDYLLEHEPQMITPIIDDLMPALEHVAKNQEKYDAPVDIYGSYLNKLSHIKGLCRKLGRLG